jgi:hypothetical protein
MFIDSSITAKSWFEETVPYVLPLVAAILGPLAHWVFVTYDRHEQRKRILDLAEKRLSFWKAKADIQRTYYAEKDLNGSVEAAVCRIEKDANRELTELVWLQRLYRDYSKIRVSLLLYKPEHAAKRFSRYRFIYWSLFVVYILFACWLVYALNRYPLPKQKPNQLVYLIGVAIYFVLFFALGAAVSWVRSKAQKLLRPEPPLYDSI